MPLFNVTVFPLNHLLGNVRMHCYNASSENYFQMATMKRKTFKILSFLTGSLV